MRIRTQRSVGYLHGTLYSISLQELAHFGEGSLRVQYTWRKQSAANCVLLDQCTPPTWGYDEDEALHGRDDKGKAKVRVRVGNWPRKGEDNPCTSCRLKKARRDKGINSTSTEWVSCPVQVSVLKPAVPICILSTGFFWGRFTRAAYRNALRKQIKFGLYYGNRSTPLVLQFRFRNAENTVLNPIPGPLSQVHVGTSLTNSLHGLDSACSRCNR